VPLSALFDMAYPGKNIFSDDLVDPTDVALVRNTHVPDVLVAPVVLKKRFESGVRDQGQGQHAGLESGSESG
jgi:hypothetical protein